MSMPTKQPQTRNAMSMCAVESAIQHSRPGEKVILWTLDIQARASVESLAKLEDHGVLICDAALDHLFKETPFEGWNCTGKYCQNNESNALRLALLYKFGGIYLDLDIISIRNSVSRVGNLAITQWENKTWYNNAYMNFPAGHKLLWLLMSKFVQDFEGDRYGHNGPRLLDRVVIPCLQSGALECKDLSLAAESVYAPISWKDTNAWLNSTEGDFGVELNSLRARASWGIHWYASQWFNIHDVKQGGRPCLGCQSMGHVLFKDNCPHILQRQEDQLMCSHC